MEDVTVTRDQLAEQVAEFLANPAGWPAAMGARAMRLRAGHPAYSPTNQALIICQLFARYAGQMSDDDAFARAIADMSQEIAPRGVWRKRGFEPTAGAGLSIWSRPIPVFVDTETGKRAYRRDKLGESESVESYTTFTVERTYLASDVSNDSGDSGDVAFGVPELPAGHARDVFDMLAAWITGQGWHVERSGRDTVENGSTSHAVRMIRIHGGLADWAAVETLAHEITHALLHGDDDDRPYAGEHRGDMEAEAESVAFGLLTAFGQHELARGSARYAAEWTRDAGRVAIAYERACHITDALVNVALGATDVTVRESAKAAKMAAKASNRELAARLRDVGIEPRGKAWSLAKSGADMSEIMAAAS